MFISEKYIDNMVAKSRESIPRLDGDYEKDGLLYCGKCNTPKERKVDFGDFIKYPRCLCRCAEADREREAEAQKIKMRESVRALAFPDADMMGWTFDNDDGENPRITEAMKRYAAKFDEINKSLVLYGNAGTGKTFAACEVMNALIDKGYRCKFTSFTRMINELQGTFEKQEYIDSLNDYDFIVFDDLSAERYTDFARSQVYEIINSRYRSGKPFIVTTNLTAEQIKRPQTIDDERIYDRLIGCSLFIEFTGHSRRKKQAVNDYPKLKEMLGL